MTSNHIFYIPLILIAGAVIGFLLGRKAVLGELEQQQRREERREARRAAREGGSAAGEGTPGKMDAG